MNIFSAFSFRRGTGAFASLQNDKDCSKGYKLRDTDLRLRKSRQQRASPTNSGGDHDKTELLPGDAIGSKRELRMRASSRDSDRSDCSNVGSSAGGRRKRRRADSTDMLPDLRRLSHTQQDDSNIFPKAKVRRENSSFTSLIVDTALKEDENINVKHHNTRNRVLRRNTRNLTKVEPLINTVTDEKLLKKRVVRLRNRRQLGNSDPVTIEVVECTAKSLNGVPIGNFSLNVRDHSSRCSEDGNSDNSSDCSDVSSTGLGGSKQSPVEEDNDLQGQDLETPGQSFRVRGQNPAAFEQRNLSLLVTARPPLRSSRSLSFEQQCDGDAYHNLSDNSINADDVRNNIIDSVNRTSGTSLLSRDGTLLLGLDCSHVHVNSNSRNKNTLATKLDASSCLNNIQNLNTLLEDGNHSNSVETICGNNEIVNNCNVSHSGSVTPSKDVYEFEDEDVASSSPSLGLRRSPPCGSSPRTPVTAPPRWCQQTASEAATDEVAIIPKVFSVPAPQSQDSGSQDECVTPAKNDPKRLRIKLRKLHLKRSPVLDEVIAVGDNIRSSHSISAFEPEYEVMTVDGFTDSSYCCPDEAAQSACTAWSPSRKGRSSIDDCSDGGDDTPVLQQQPRPRQMTRVRLILGQEISTRTIKLPLVQTMQHGRM